MNFWQLRNFHHYALAWENYLLLARVIRTAWQVRRVIPASSITPKLVSALPAIDSFYLPPQPNWRLSDAKKVAWFANFIVNFPVRWGKCLQRSLIVYRLLNGYGEPARLLVGVDETDATADGHVWVVRLCDGDRVFAEAVEPRERFTVIYASPLP
ncbi:MAG TPA: lasso peptide biosynthesis B2 protein [Blastocatellia bacterium]|nr:lasso peptide biosynthesis B2 protein [Blastocatellia bacterium]